MRTTRTQSRICAGAVCWLALLLLAGWHSHAAAQELSLQTQLEYRWVETKSSDGLVESFGRFSPLYLVILRGPLLGGTSTQLDLGLTGYSSGDPRASVDQRNLRLNLLAQGTRLNLLFSASRDTNRVTLTELDGSKQTSLAVADNYALSGILAYPAYPTVSLQYQKSALRAERGTDVEAAIWMVGANYDWGPFRFIADQVKQEVAFTEFSSQTRRYGVNFSRSLLPTVRLTVDHYSTFAELATQGRQFDTVNRITTARLSALPTSFLVVDGEFSLLASSQEGEQGLNEWAGQNHALYLRSEVFPGVRLDISRQGQAQHSSFGDTSSGQTSANLAVQLRPTTSLLANWNKSTAADATGQTTTGQEGQRFSLTTQLSPETDLFVDYGRTSQAFLDSRYRTVSAVFGIRGQLDPTLSLGAAYRYDRRDTTQAGSTSQALAHSLQLEGAWLPHDLWSLSAGLGLVRAEDSARSLLLAPYVDARWDMDPATSVTVRYNVQRLEEESRATGSPSSGSRTATGFTGRLTHRLANGATLEVNYDYQKAFAAPFVWQKVLQVRHSRNF